MRAQSAGALQPRLRCAVSMIENEHGLIDVGTNHGRLCAYLLSEGWTGKLIASDVSAPSLDRARERLQKLGMEDKVDLRVGDGLQVLSPCEVQTAVICGMGSNTIVDILSAAPREITEKLSLILQPQGSKAPLRKFLQQNGWKITKEKLVKDAGRFYVVLRAERGEMPAFDEEWAEIGEKLVLDHDPLLADYIEWNLRVWKKAYAAAQKGAPDENGEKLARLIARGEEVLQWLNRN